MEIYLLLALIFIYLITAADSNKIIVRRIWTSAFILSFILSAGALVLLKISHEDVMMSSETFNWFYLLYIFGTLAFALGCINLWMYRRPLWDIFVVHQDETKE